MRPLEWAWKVLSTHENISELDATSRIKEMLFKLGSENQIDFKQQINEMPAPAHPL